MNFASDNHYGASVEILGALAAVGQSPAPAYGDDAITKHQDHRGQLFASLLAQVDQDAS